MLGTNARPTGEVLRYRGEDVGWLFTLGRPLKGVLWETTGVREIREQAQSLAERLLEEKCALVLASIGSPSSEEQRLRRPIGFSPSM